MLEDGVDPTSRALIGRFYRGQIVRLRFGSHSGQIRAIGSGRVIPFRFALVRLLGVESFHELREGMEVGFDVGWTSGGLRVCTIKVFTEEPAETTDASEAGESGEEGSGGSTAPES